MEMRHSHLQIDPISTILDHMRTVWLNRAVTTALVVLTIHGSSQAASPTNKQLKALYDTHRCFDLREAEEQGAIPAFYRAVVACSFREQKRCDKGLAKIVRDAPRSDDAYEALSLSADFNLAAGRYHLALANVKAMLRMRPADQDAQNGQALLAALTAFPDQKTIRYESSTVAVAKLDGNVGTAVSINGKEATYIFDTGANVSSISESEAARLGLSIKNTKSTVGVATGAQVGFKVANAQTLRLGNVTLQNVAFMVFPDKDEPFVDFPPTKRGILGIPVLLALKTLRIRNGKYFDLAFRPSKVNIREANMCMFGPTASTQLAFEGKKLDFALDTGAIHTDLYSPFADAFPSVVASQGHRDIYTQHGVGSSKKLDSVVLPSLDFSLAGFPLKLSPARILLQHSVEDNSSYFFGNLGMDLLNQPNTLTIDFQAMRLSLQ